MSEAPVHRGGAVLERPLLWWAFALILMLIPGAAMVAQRPIEIPATLAELPDFHLIDQDGETVRRFDLAGQVVVLDFVFTRCPDVCPMMSMHMAEVQKRVGGDRRGRMPVTLVSVSVDPDYDTPDVLSSYAERYDAHTTSWRFLTGPLPEIEKLLDGMMLAAVRDPNMGDAGGVPTIAHSQRFAVIDGGGGVRGFFAPHEGDLDQLVAVVRALASEGVGVSQ